MELIEEMNSSLEMINDFDFCDGHIKSISLDGDCAVLSFCNWKEEEHTFVFRNVTYFKCYEFGDDITKVQVLHQSQEIDEAVKLIRTAGGKAEGYNDFAFCQMNFEGCCNLNCIIVFLELEVKKL